MFVLNSPHSITTHDSRNPRRRPGLLGSVTLSWIAMLVFAWTTFAQEPTTDEPPKESPAAEETGTAEPPQTEASESAATQDASESNEETAASEVRRTRYRPPAGAYFSMHVPGYRASVDAMLTTKLGELSREKDMVAVLEKIETRYTAKMEAIEALVKLAKELDVEIPIEDRVSEALESFREIEYEGITMHIYLEAVEGEEPDVTFLASALFDPEDAEKLTELLPKLEGLLADSEFEKQNTPERKIGESKIHCWKDSDSDEFAELAYFHAGDEVWFAIDGTDELAGLTTDAPAEPAEIDRQLFDSGTRLGAFSVDLAKVFELYRKEQEEDDRDMTQVILEFLGIASLETVRAGVAADGPDIREKLILDMKETGKGLLASLRPIPKQGEGVPPVLPALDPELVHVRGSFDPQKILDAFLGLADKAKEDGEFDEEDEKLIARMRRVFDAFHGGMSMIFAAPKFGLPIPRMVFAFGIADEEAYREALAEVKERMEGIGFDEVEYKEVRITTVKIPNNPSPIVPAFAVVDGALVISDSPATLRSLVSAKSDGTESRGPVSPEDRRDALVCRYDSKEIFKLMYEKALPLVQLGLGQLQRSTGMTSQPLLNLAELPQSTLIAKYLGEGSARITWTGKGLEMTAASPLGDPLAALMASIIVPLTPLFTGMSLDETRGMWEERVCRARVEKIYEAIVLHRGTFGAGKRYPDSLGELVTRGLIEDDDMFLVPSDKDPTTIEYETEFGDIEEISVSYNYLPNSKLVVKKSDLDSGSILGTIAGAPLRIQWDLELEDVDDEEDPDRTILLYETNRNEHGGRFVLTTEGEVYHLDESRFQQILSMTK